MAQGYVEGNNPYNINISPVNTLCGHTGFNLEGEYTFSSPFVVSSGKVQVIAFGQYDDANSQNFFKTLQSVNTAYSSSDTSTIFKIVGILYNENASINNATFNNTVDNILRTDADPAKQATYDFANNQSVWSTSSAYNYLVNYGTGIVSPCVYIINKNYAIAYKTHLGLHSGNVASMVSAIDTAVSGLLAAPTVTSIEPSTITPYNALGSIGVTFSEAVLHAADPLNYTFGGAGLGTIPVHPADVTVDTLIPNKYILTPGAGSFGDGPLTLTLDNITDAVFSTPVKVADADITYTMDALPPRVVNVRISA